MSQDQKPKDDLEAALQRAAVAPPPEDAEIAADDSGATALAENVGKEPPADKGGDKSAKP